MYSYIRMQFKKKDDNNFGSVSRMAGNLDAQKRHRWFFPLLIFTMTFIAYVPAINGKFIWDDDAYVFNNPLLTSPGGLLRIWTTTESPQYYPMVFTSFWIEHRLWGFNPIGYHIVNVALHAINAIMAWLILRRLEVRGAWLIGAIFALHPVHVESVAWVTERKNVLSGFFYLLAMRSYLRFEEEKGEWQCYFLSLLFFILALLGKTVTCTLPVIFLVLRWFRGLKIRRCDLYRLAPFVLLGMGMGLLTVWYETYHVMAKGEEWNLSILQRFLLAGRNIWFYVIKLAWPVNLTFIYPRREPDAFDLWQWAWTFGVIIVGLISWWVRRWLGRGLLAGWVFFAVTLFPALGFFNIYPMRYSFVADHFQYLASLGIITVCVGSVAWLAERRRYSSMSGWRVHAGRGVAFIVLFVLGILTWRQGYVYKDLETLWRDTVTKNSGAWMAYNNLGAALFEQGKVKEAIEHYMRSLEGRPNKERTYNNIGTALENLGRLDEAVRYLKLALSIKPDYAEAYNNLGIALFRQGKFDEAIGHFKYAMLLNPASAGTHNNLGIALVEHGEVDEAIKHFKQALKIKPIYPDARNNLDLALIRKGKVGEVKP